MKTFDLPKELVLDYDKWRSGNHSDSQVGVGPVRMLNNEGFMCCLGQFSQQAGVCDQINHNAPSPHQDHVAEFIDKRGACIPLSILATKAIDINDGELPAIKKGRKLQELFKEYGFTVTLKNFPKEEAHD